MRGPWAGAAVALTLAATVAWASPAAAQAGPPAWLEYSPPAEYEAITEAGIAVPMRDGVELSCDLYRPGRDGAPVAGEFPGVVWQFHGYGTNRASRDGAHTAFLAERGYVGLQCSVRGTGGSPGTWDPFGALEPEDGYDIVEWLASQDFSDGQVAMAGYSYGAITTYLTAALAPPHLVTIIPQSSYEDPYLDIVRLGGIRGLDVRAWVLALIHGLNAVGTPPDQQAALLPRSQEIDAEWDAHPLHDEYWEARRVDHDAIRATGIPILGYGGWYDIYQRGMPENQMALPDQTWLVMEPNAHIGGAYFGSLDRGVLAWLDHWLQGRPDAPLPEAKITSFEMPLDGGGGWTSFAAWPPAETGPRRLHLTGAGELAASPGAPAELTYPVDPTDGTPAYWNTGTRPDDPVLTRWHTEREAGRLAFTTEPFAEDVVLAGAATARLTASFTADDGYLVVRVSDVAPDGTATLVSTGWLQASHRDGHTALAPVEPGEEATYDVEIWPSHWRFAEGYRLQVSISSGDVPRIHPDAPAGDVTILAGDGASYLDVPIVGAGAPAPDVGIDGPEDESSGNGPAGRPLPATGGGMPAVAGVLALAVALAGSAVGRSRHPR